MENLKKKSHRCRSTAFRNLPAKLRHISHKYANAGYCVLAAVTYEQKARRVCLFFFAYLVLLYELAYSLAIIFYDNGSCEKKIFFSPSFSIMTHCLAALWMAFLRVYNWRGLVNELIVLSSKMLRKLPKHCDFSSEAENLWKYEGIFFYWVFQTLCEFRQLYFFLFENFSLFTFEQLDCIVMLEETSTE